MLPEQMGDGNRLAPRGYYSSWLTRFDLLLPVLLSDRDWIRMNQLTERLFRSIRAPVKEIVVVLPLFRTLACS
jgi:hypothetical protein